MSVATVASSFCPLVQVKPKSFDLARTCSMSCHLWRTSDQLPSTTSVPNCPISGHFWPEWAYIVRPLWANLGRLRSMLAHQGFDQDWVELDRRRPDFVQVWPELAQRGRSRPSFVLVRPGLDQSRVDWERVGLISTSPLRAFDRLGPNFLKLGSAWGDFCLIPTNAGQFQQLLRCGARAAPQRCPSGAQTALERHPKSPEQSGLAIRAFLEAHTGLATASRDFAAIAP